MKKSFKTLILIGALATTTVQFASAVMVKHNAGATGKSNVRASVSTTSFAAAPNAALFKSFSAMHKAQSRKQGFFDRIVVKRLLRTAAVSKVAAALLAFFLGSLGVHRFYLGHNSEGFMQLAGSLFGVGFLFLGLTTFSIWLTFLGGAIVSAVSIWALVDFICILAGSLQPLDGSYE